jgi:hypothetical protein
MKKTTLLFITIVSVICWVPNLFAVIGPIPIDLSNDLPDGYVYCAVTVTLLPDHCPGPYDGVEIAVDANQDILTPGPNFGIQAFGFNYNGNLEELSLNVPDDPANKWKVQYGKNISEFGVYLVDESGTGNTRKDPLVLDVCNCNSDLMEGNFIVKNSKGYVFAVHIADFTFNGEPSISSAFFSTVNTTLIELVGLEAIPGVSQVVIYWTTASEVDNVGFNIYRAESKNGKYDKINNSLIPAEGSPIEGTTYDFIDSEVQNRRIYYYQLEDIDVYGKSTFHGPVSATPRLIYVVRG